MQCLTIPAAGHTMHECWWTFALQRAQQLLAALLLCLHNGQEMSAKIHLPSQELEARPCVCTGKGSASDSGKEVMRY